MSRQTLLPLILLLLLFACNREEDGHETLLAPFLQLEVSSVDSVLLQMSTDEKIGQLLFYQPDSLDLPSLYQLASANRLTGIQLGEIPLLEYFRIVDSLQGLSQVPLFNASSEAIALHNQFSDLSHFPNSQSILAINNDSLQGLIAQQWIQQQELLGINISFNPAIDRRHPVSPHGSHRPFGFNPEEVIHRSSQQLEALQSRKILSVSGEFKDLHFIPNDTTHVLDSILHPYYNLVQNGLSGLKIDGSICQVDTLSRDYVAHYLKDKLDFDGLTFGTWADSISFENLAFAGIDIFLVKDSVQWRHDYIKSYVDKGIFTEEELNNRVRKVLLAKAWVGLDSLYQMPSVELAVAKMTQEQNQFYVRQLYEQSLTLVQNPDETLPFKHTYKRNFRLVQIGEEDLWKFQYHFSKYAAFTDYRIPPDSTGRIPALNYKRLRNSKVVITLDEQFLKAQRDSAFIQSVNQLAGETEVVLVNFGDARNLQHFDTTAVLVQAYERNELMESFTAQLLFGALQAKGKLPLPINEHIVYQQGIDSTPITRLKYTVPEEVGIASYKLVGIDALARRAIRNEATPGCQVLVIKEGKVIYSKAFGTHTYDKKQLVQKRDLYDLASLTKVAATSLAMMKLYEEKKLQLNGSLSKYLDLEKSSNIKKITLKQLLTHQSGLQSNMPIAPYIMFEDSIAAVCNQYFCKAPDTEYSVSVADSFYMHEQWIDTIWHQVYDLNLRSRRKRYLYSDVNFNLLQKVIETKAKTRLDEIVNLNFYYPLNLTRCTYNPLESFPEKQIVPTAEDERWRKQLLRGYVHDESAALLGGIGGNAGLFGNTEELAVVFQMLLNKGEYGGKRYLQESTIKQFTSKQRGTNRGLGFDVQTKKGTRGCSPKASAATFGHTGFTGTCVWVDPEEELIFVFLSNRIHPNVKNRLLYRDQVREKIHSLVYEALDTYDEEPKEIPTASLEANIQ